MRRAFALLAVPLVLGSAAGAGTPGFHSSAEPIGPALRARMTSWRPGCPVRIGDLRLLRASYRGFDGATHQGVLVVNVDAVPAVVAALRSLFDARFPIRRMRLVEGYGADDDRSMAADNTSAFNCRRVTGSGTWSEHAYGRAIDVDPLENPEIRGSVVSPPGGAAYVDRSRRAPGMIHAGDATVRAFAAVGWRWGGYWHSPKDYQHFSATGR